MYMLIWVRPFCICLFFFFNDTATTEIYTLSLHDALPICVLQPVQDGVGASEHAADKAADFALSLEEPRSEEHTSELQSPCNLVCRLLLEKKKKSPGPVMQQDHTLHPYMPAHTMLSALPCD